VAEALHHTEKELQERTGWALRLQNELALYQASRWVRLGRKIGMGPIVPAG
jgi:hypothetical protein